MDINTIRVLKNNVNTKEAETMKPAEKKQDKKDIIRNGCLKLTDYMVY
ncbi:hypothetical protein OXPF_22270 [Oxobacter pfennigii]|uniref:Uncharacterized protein n=1 Tax=Oxobacter pfennigii TaxID=36849 RepID=A0A0P8W5U0_9CLOT|nr:hypothetical protein [Oxobacter pfennigii]KPU44061.1 hypothetical protein OXPF_22270 [Oxobacter pfennigii]